MIKELIFELCDCLETYKVTNDIEDLQPIVISIYDYLHTAPPSPEKVILSKLYWYIKTGISRHLSQWHIDRIYKFIDDLTQTMNL